MAIKGIFFDAADVFYERDESTASFVWQLLTERGYSSRLSAEEQARQQVLNHQANGGLVSPGTFWNEVLKQRGFLLGIITDTIYPLEWKMDWLEQVGVAEFIDVVACSCTLGVHKPDAAIYLNAVQQANLTVAEAAFVGHDAGELEGARQVGLATVAVLYDPHAQADHYAETLPDLLNVPIFQTC